MSFTLAENLRKINRGFHSDFRHFPSFFEAILLLDTRNAERQLDRQNAGRESREQEEKDDKVKNRIEASIQNWNVFFFLWQGSTDCQVSFGAKYSQID